MYAQVVDDVTKVLTLDPDKVGLRAVRAQAYYHLGRYAESLDDLEEIRQAGGRVNPKLIEVLRKRVDRTSATR
jgi:hypothetical protein